MRYFTNINNVKCLEWGLNANQGALFDLLNQASSWADTYIIDNEVFYHVSRNLVLRELPLFYTKDDTVYRNLKHLQEKGLIEYKKVGKKDVVRLTKKGKEWNMKFGSESESGSKSGNGSEESRNEIRKNSDTNPTNNNTNKNNTREKNYKESRRHIEKDNIYVKEIERVWLEKGLKEFEYTPVESVNIAIKEFTLIKVLKAIELISESSFMRDKTTINRFFNKKNNFEQIRYALDGEYDDKKPEIISGDLGYTMEDLEYTFSLEEEWLS